MDIRSHTAARPCKKPDEPCEFEITRPKKRISIFNKSGGMRRLSKYSSFLMNSWAAIRCGDKAKKELVFAI